MYSLNNIGRSVETFFGRDRYLGVYAADAVAGCIASFCFNPAPSVGASGAILGLVGAHMVFLKRNEFVLGRQRVEEMMQVMGGMVLINALLGFTNPRLDNWGHGGGFAGGALASWALGPAFEIVGGRLTDHPPI